MDTDALRLFVIAADLLNISAAGRQLGLSPAVAGARQWAHQGKGLAGMETGRSSPAHSAARRR